jgi:hypothetical protein
VSRVLFSPHTWQHLFCLAIYLFIYFWWSPSWQNLSEVLICIPFMTKDVEHSFMYLLAIWISSLDNCLLNSFAYLVIGLFVLLLLSFLNSFYILNINPLSSKYLAMIFFPILWVVSWFWKLFLLMCKSFQFDTTQFVNFYSHFLGK